MLPYSRTIGKDEELWVCSDFHLGPGKKLVILHLGDLSLQDDGGVRAGQFFDLGNERVCVLTTPGNHASGLPSLAGTRYGACILPEQGSRASSATGKGRVIRT